MTQASKKRMINGGDQVKLSSSRFQSDRMKQHDTLEIQEESIDNDIQLSSQGLRFDFRS